MTYLNNLYKKPQINLVDGVATDESLLNLSFQIETGFDEVGNAIGNIYGNALGTKKDARYFNAISTAIGNMGGLSPEQPFGVKFDSYSQTFINSNAKKDFILDLIPTPSEMSSIAIVSTDGNTWQLRQSDSMLESSGDFSVNGRVLSFFVAPSGTFSIIYTGRYPRFMEEDGYMPNVYPSPQLIAQGIIPKPKMEITSEGRYKVTFTESNRNSEGVVFGDKLELHFSKDIEPYVSAIGDREVPSEYVNAWVFRSGEYVKIECRSIYLLSPTAVEFDTDEELNVRDDVIVISIANVTISRMLKSLYDLMLNHDHDKSSGLSAIDHASLTGLVPISSRDDIIYSKSRLSSNDHPQYMSREGYTPNDPGTYNNIMIGDLILGSTDPASLFNNSNANSNRLIFGSTSNGISIRYRATENDLHLYSPDNGLSLNTATGEGKQSSAISFNGQELFTYGIDDGNSGFNQSLALSSATERVLVLNSVDPSLFADMQAQHLYSEDATLTGELKIIQGGKISLGNVSMIEQGGNMIISADPSKRIIFTAKTRMDDLSAGRVEAETVLVEDDLILREADSQIIFSDNGQQSSISNSPDAQIRVNSGLPLDIRTSISLEGVSGRGADSNTIQGITFSDKDVQIGQAFSSLYVSSQSGGKASPSQASTYLEMLYPESVNLEKSTNGLFLLRSTKTPQIQDDIKHAWKSDEAGSTRIDDLIDWPRAKITAGYGDYYAIKVRASTLVKKEGIKLGEFNNIFAIGDKGDCPTGLLVVEALSGVVFVSSGADPSDCSSMSYSPVTTGELKVQGSVASEGDISSGGHLNALRRITGNSLVIEESANVTGLLTAHGDAVIDKTLFVNGTSKFNNNVSINGNLEISIDLSCNKLSVGGVSEFKEIARFRASTLFQGSAQFESGVSFDDKVFMEGRLTGQEIYATDVYLEKLVASKDVFANAGLEVTSTAIFNGLIQAKSSIDVGGSLVVNGPAYTQTLSVQKDLNVTDKSIFGGTVSTESHVTLNGGGDEKLTINILSQFNKKVQINEGGDLAGDFKLTGDLNVFGNGFITALKAGEVEIKQGLIVGGKIHAEALDIALDTLIGGSLKVGPISSQGNVSLKGELEDTLTVSMPAIFGKDIKVSNGSHTTGPVVIEGSLNLTGGDTRLETVHGENLFINNQLEAKGRVVTGSTLVREDLEVKKGVTAKGGLVLLGGIISEGGISSKGGLKSEGDSELGGKLLLGGGLTMSGPLSVTSQEVSDLFLLGLKFVCKKLAVFEDGVSIAEDLEVGGTANIGGGLSLGGPLTAESLVLQRYLEVGDSVKIGGDVKAGGLFEAGGSGKFGGPIEAEGGGKFAGSIIASGGGGDFAGPINATGGGSFGGPIVASGGGDFAGPIVSTGGGSFDGPIVATGGGSFAGAIIASGGGGDFNGPINAAGGGDFGGPIVATGGGSFGGPINATGGGSFGGAIITSVGGGQFAGPIIADGGGTFDGSIIATGGGDFGGPINAAGGGEFAGSIKATGGGGDFAGPINATGGGSFGGPIVATGGGDFGGSIVAAGGAELGGPVRSTGGGSFGGPINATGGGSFGGPVVATGGGKFGGPINADGGGSFGGSIIATGGADFGENVKTTGSLKVGAGTTSSGDFLIDGSGTESLTVRLQAGFSAPVQFDSGAKITGKLAISAGLSAKGHTELETLNATSIDVSGSLSVANDARVGLFTASGDIIGKETATIEKGLTIKSGGLSVQGNTALSGNLTVKDEGTNTCSIGVTSNFAKNVRFAGGVDINAASSANGLFTFTGQVIAAAISSTGVDIKGNLSVSEVSTLNATSVLGTLTAQGAVSFAQSLAVIGPTSIQGQSGELLSVGLESNFSALSSFGKGIRVAGDAEVKGDCTITGEAKASSLRSTTADISGAVTVGGAGRFIGSVLANDLAAVSTLTVGSHSVLKGNAAISLNLSVLGNSQINGTLTVDNKTTLKQGLTTNNGSSSTIYRLRVEGGLQVSGNISGENIDLSGAVNAIGSGNFGGSGKFNGSGDFGGSLKSGGAITGASTIQVAGDIISTSGGGRFPSGIVTKMVSVVGPLVPDPASSKPWVDVSAKEAYYG